MDARFFAAACAMEVERFREAVAVGARYKYKSPLVAELVRVGVQEDAHIRTAEFPYQSIVIGGKPHFHPSFAGVMV